MFNMTAFREEVAGELHKEANLWLHGAEIGGLGVLARPSVQALRRKDTSPHERSAAKHELAGLGILAVPSAYEVAKAGIRRIRK